MRDRIQILGVPRTSATLKKEKKKKLGEMVQGKINVDGEGKKG